MSNIKPDDIELGVLPSLREADISMGKKNVEKLVSDGFLKQNPTVLTLFCGSGRTELEVVSQVLSDPVFISTDFEANQLKCLEKKASERKLQLSVVHEKAQNLKSTAFQNSHLHLIWCQFGLMYLSKDQIVQLFDGIRPSIHPGTILALKENVLNKGLKNIKEQLKEETKT